MNRIYLYSRFERFWHWVQGGFVIILIITGLEVHGYFKLLGFERAVEIHNMVAWSWIVLYAFIVFWLLTTGEIRQYIPTSRRMLDVVFYYSFGIFKGMPHPIVKSPGAKHNPLQRIVYLIISAILIPIQITTGFFYYTYNHWPSSDYIPKLESLALIHTMGLYALTAFLFVHIYMTLTGHTIFSHIIAMITGWEDIPTLENHGLTSSKTLGRQDGFFLTESDKNP